MDDRKSLSETNKGYWQKYYKGKLSEEDYRRIVENIQTFWKTLEKWAKEAENDERGRDSKDN